MPRTHRPSYLDQKLKVQKSAPPESEASQAIRSIVKRHKFAHYDSPSTAGLQDMLNFRVSMKSDSDHTTQGVNSKQSFSTPRLKMIHGMSNRPTKERQESAPRIGL